MVVFVQSVVVTYFIGTSRWVREVVETYRFDPSTSLSAVKWSSFEDREFQVRIEATYLRGQQAWDGRQVRNTAGSGQFIRPHKAGQAS